MTLRPKTAALLCDSVSVIKNHQKLLSYYPVIILYLLMKNQLKTLKMAKNDLEMT